MSDFTVLLFFCVESAQIYCFELKLLVLLNEENGTIFGINKHYYFITYEIIIYNYYIYNMH